MNYTLSHGETGKLSHGQLSLADKSASEAQIRLIRRHVGDRRKQPVDRGVMSARYLIADIVAVQKQL